MTGSRSALAIVALCMCLGGVATAQSERGTAGAPDSASGLTEEQRRELERIATLGYVDLGAAASREAGAVLHEPGALDGYTAFVSRDHGGAFLVNMEGTTVHEWHDGECKNWVRVWVYPDGCALGISTKPARLIKLYRDSRVLWTYGGFNLKAHHDVQVEPSGRIYSLMRTARKIPWFPHDGGVNDDLVVVLEPEGDSVTETARVSILEAFRASEFADLLSEPWFTGADPLHANSIEVLDGRIPHVAFRPGNVLLSLRNIDALAVLDLDLREIVWFDRGLWQMQHEARVTDEGRILLFDNRKHDGRSRVVEYDTAAGRIVWTYTAEGFFSAGAGAQQRLPNGNTLVTESEQGRIFEITRDGRVVWDFVSPRRFRGGQTVVRVPRALRVPMGFFDEPFRSQLLANAGGG